MKIYILGPSGSGKTTLAKNIAKVYSTPTFHSDFVLSKHIPEERKKIKLTRSEYVKKINKILLMGNWIFEGKHLIPKLLINADKIVWLKTPICITLFRQWKRYFTDINQRRLFTFRNNYD